jgi:serine/threonine protein kinase
MDHAFRSAVPDELTGDILIGAGRYGSVFKASWHANCADAVAAAGGHREPVATIKGACPYGLGDPCKSIVVAVKRTTCSVDEARLLSLVSHRHVIKLFGACVDRVKGSFLVTEFCAEGSLYQ